jgi:hypothetical protein
MLTGFVQVQMSLESRSAQLHSLTEPSKFYFRIARV